MSLTLSMAPQLLGLCEPATIIDVSHAGDFLDKFNELYLDSFLANIMVGLLLGALGLFVILRRIVFLSAALSQVSGAGLALAFFIGALAAHNSPIQDARPVAPPGEVLDKHKPEDDADKDIQNFLDEDDDDGAEKKTGMRAAPMATPPARPRPEGPMGATGPASRSPSTAGKQPAMATGPPPAPPKVSTASHHGTHQPIRPIFMSLILTGLVALLLSELSRGQRRSTQESIVGLVFIVASAASIPRWEVRSRNTSVSAVRRRACRHDGAGHGLLTGSRPRDHARLAGTDPRLLRRAAAMEVFIRSLAGGVRSGYA